VDVGHTHRNVTGGWLRPAVFGVMDGLVSNFALVAGVAAGAAGAKLRTVDARGPGPRLPRRGSSNTTAPASDTAGRTRNVRCA
jgi:hypothetical protein